MHQLLENVFGKAFSNPILDSRHDSAQFNVPPGKLAMTTDSMWCVRSFSRRRHRLNGDSRHGERPRHERRAPALPDCGFIIEEGMLMETLWRVVC